MKMLKKVKKSKKSSTARTVTAFNVLQLLQSHYEIGWGVTLTSEDVKVLMSDDGIRGVYRDAVTEHFYRGGPRYAICYAPLTGDPPPNDLLRRCNGTRFKYCKDCWCVRDSALKKDAGNA